MVSDRHIDGFFWHEAYVGHYCVVAFDDERTERVGRRQQKWVREWHAHTITELRDMARTDGIVLPRNARALCEQAPHHHKNCRR